MGAPLDLPKFPPRATDAHKGQVGRILIVGGRFDSIGMVGAPAMTANAALRAGAGLVQILTTREAQLPVSVLASCATTRAWPDAEGHSLPALASEYDADVVAIGPGLSPTVTPDQMRDLLANFEGGIVIDADGLNLLAAMSGRGTARLAARADQVVLTPHPGEMRRLLKGYGIDVDVSERQASTEALAAATRTIVVHKGAGTVVSDGKRIYINSTGHSGMATGGAGDVLTGVIAALMGQTMPAYEAAVLGVYLHGMAGELAADELGEISVTALDILDHVADAVDIHIEQPEGR